MTVAPAIDLGARPYELAWADVDPLRWTFEADAARDAALAVDALMDTPREDGVYDTWRDRCESAIDAAFVRRHGPWACGWRHGAEDGGPVTTWRGADDVLRAGPDADPAPTARRAAAALVQWREWLEALAASFAEHAPVPLDARALDAALRATWQDVRGRAEQPHTAQVLAWQLEAYGADGREARELLAGHDGDPLLLEEWLPHIADVGVDLIEAGRAARARGDANKQE